MADVCMCFACVCMHACMYDCMYVWKSRWMYVLCMCMYVCMCVFSRYERGNTVVFDLVLCWTADFLFGSLAAVFSSLGFTHRMVKHVEASSGTGTVTHVVYCV